MSLIPFPSRPDSALPPDRQAYARHMAEKAALGRAIIDRRAERGRLAAHLAVLDGAEAEVDRLVDEDARSLLGRLRDGLAAPLASFGSRAQTLGEKIAASGVQIKIATRAIASLDGEIEQLGDDLAAMNAQTAGMIRAVINEASAGLRADRAQAVDNLRESLTRCAAVDRFLAAERHDWAPATRVAIVIPNLLWADLPPEEVLLAPAREIRGAMAVLEQFAAALAHDPLASFPEFPPVDPAPDADTLFHELTLVEMADVTRNATYTTRQRDDALPESRNIATQVLDAAKAAIGI